MSDHSSPERRVFRPAVIPVFLISFGVALLGGFAAYLHDTPFSFVGLVFLFLASGIVSLIATLFVWWVTAEVVSADGVGIWSILGRRLLPWENLTAIRSFSTIRLLCLRFHSESQGTRRVLIFQRQRGEFRRTINDLIPKESLAWKKVIDVEPDGPANRSQPIRTETNRTSETAGSDR